MKQLSVVIAATAATEGELFMAAINGVVAGIGYDMSDVKATSWLSSCQAETVRRLGSIVYAEVGAQRMLEKSLEQIKADKIRVDMYLSNNSVYAKSVIDNMTYQHGSKRQLFDLLDQEYRYVDTLTDDQLVEYKLIVPVKRGDALEFDYQGFLRLYNQISAELNKQELSRGKDIKQLHNEAKFGSKKCQALREEHYLNKQVLHKVKGHFNPLEVCLDAVVVRTDHLVKGDINSIRRA